MLALFKKIMKWSAILLVLMIVLGLIFGEDQPKTSEAVAAKVPEEQKQPEPAKAIRIGEAKPYTIALPDSDHGDRKGTLFITSDASSLEDRAATAKQAALDYSKKSGKQAVKAFLVFDKLSVGKGGVLASALYFADGCGFSGRDCNGVEWEIESTGQKVTAEQLAAYHAWEKNKKKFTDKNGDIDEDKLKNVVAKQLNMSPEKIDLPYITGLVKVDAYRSDAEKKEGAARVEAASQVATARQSKIEKQFSPWDGSHRKLERLIKQSMNDPDSYEHDKTVFFDQKDHLIVITTFRGRNQFGGMVRNTVKAKVGLDGEIEEIIEQM